MLRDTELAGLARTLGNDTNLTITVGGDNSYCSSDGSNINIARMPSTSLGRMLMTGLVFHEVAHKKHTQGGRPQGLLGDLTNIIEDVRVEALTIQDRPGTRYDLEAVTTYYAGKGDLTPTDTSTSLLGLVLSYGYGEILQHHAVKELHATCQTMLAEALGSAFVTDLLQLLDKDFPILSSTIDAQSLAQRILDRLKQVPEKEKSSAAQVDEDSEEATENDSSSEGQQPQQQKSEPSTSDPTEDDSSPEGQQQKSNPTSDDSTRSDSSIDKAPAIPAAPRPTEQEIDQIISAGSGGYGDRSSAMLQDLNEIASQTPQEVLHALPLLPAAERVTQPDRYAEPLDESEAIATSSRLRSRLLTLLQGKQRRAHAAGSSGRRIDQRRLVKMAFGDPKIFRRKEELKALNTAVVTLIDGSGSMMATSGSTRTLSSIANASAFALNRTLYGLAGVSAASAVFAGREGTNIRITADFGEKPAAPLFQVRPSGSTPTDVGLWYARAALLGRPESRKLVLLITDGSPDDTDATKAATDRLLRDGIEIVAVGIQTDAVKYIWEQYCVVQDVGDLPRALFGCLENLSE